MAPTSSQRIVSLLLTTAVAALPANSALAARSHGPALEQEAEAETEPAADEQTEPDAEADADAGAESETDTEAEPGAETESDAEAETEPDAEADADAGAESETDTETDTEAEPGAETETEPDAEAEPEPVDSEPVQEDEPEATAPPPTAPAGPPEGPQRPPEPRLGGKPATGKGLMIAGGSLVAVGIAGIVTTTLITENCSFDGPLECKYRDQSSFLIPLATAPAVLGMVLLGVGAGYFARYRRWETWTPADAKARAMVVPMVSRQGGGFALSGQF